MKSISIDEDVILLVEDNPDHVMLILRAFRKGGLVNPVYVVNDGEQAIAYLGGQDKFANRTEYPLPSLILLDLKMPNKDGFEVLEWIRQQPPFSRLRVVVLTTSENLKDVNRAYDLGADSFLVKPIDLEQFVNLTRTIKGHWLWISNPPDPSTVEGENRQVRRLGPVAS
jgi:CheY-like chemotaxis protein